MVLSSCCCFVVFSQLFSLLLFCMSKFVALGHNIVGLFPFFMALHIKTRESCLAVWWLLQPKNERCQLIKAHMLSGEITGEHFQSLEYLVQKRDTFSDLVAQLSVPNS